MLGSLLFLFLTLYAYFGLGISKTIETENAIHSSFYNISEIGNEQCVLESTIAEKLEKEWWKHVDLYHAE